MMLTNEIFDKLRKIDGNASFTNEELGSMLKRGQEIYPTIKEGDNPEERFGASDLQALGIYYDLLVVTDDSIIDDYTDEEE